MVKLFNGYYFLFIAIAIVYGVVLYFCLKNKSEKVQRLVLLIICFANLLLHFVKIFFPPYINSLPGSLTRTTFANICAGTTLMMPFIFLVKKQNVLHDYIFFIGCCGGIGALAYPAEALGKFIWAFDPIRFYICHINLVVVPMVFCALKLYTPRFKKVGMVLTLWFVHLGIIFLNEVFLMQTGLVNMSTEQFFDSEYRNTSFIFGPPDAFVPVYNILFDPLVPSFLKTDFWGLTANGKFWMPIVWMIIPISIYIPIAYALLCTPFWIRNRVAKKKAVKQNA